MNGYPAEMALGVGEQVDSIEPGKFADLLLVQGNPLEDLATLSRPLSVGAPGMKTVMGDIHATLQDALEGLELSDAASSILRKVESADHTPKYQ